MYANTEAGGNHELGYMMGRGGMQRDRGHRGYCVNRKSGPAPAADAMSKYNMCMALRAVINASQPR